MNIPFGASFKKIKEQSSSWHMIFFWYRHYKVFFFLGFLVVCALGGWDYYYSVFRFRFTDEEKKLYVDSYFKETLFDEEKFHKTINGLTNRAEHHKEPLHLEKNIFEVK
ncbi:MAG: hypothetical protein PHH40_00450 [Candidatus Moranbacteria bacterium]|nr:hypothetical protein [Candidatus Moranbacteria bacterium]MDD3964782.1 hypothetical protein [Candidatus Moranbacteria bacterium]